jgi:hypothetical protein
MSHVFLSYASADRKDVSSVASTLHGLGINVWFDQWMLVPGAAWQPALNTAIENSRCTSSFVGPSGAGPWQSAETMLALDRAVKDPTYRVVPVLLPNAPPPDRLELPPVLRLFTWVDFRSGLDDPDPLRKLIAGIKGRAPGPPTSSTSEFIPNTKEPSADRRDGEGSVNAPSLADALFTIGVPKKTGSELAEWLRKECAESIQRDEVSTPFRHFRDRVQALPLSDVVKESAQQFVDDWLSSFSPSRLLQKSFYLSREKVSRAYRAYKAAIVKRLGNPSIEDDAPEDKFLMLHRFLLETGNVVFLPGRLLAGQDLVWSSDPVIYFVGAFSLERDEEFNAAFPHVGKLLAEGKAPRGIVNDVFGDPDPYKVPYLTLSGFVGQWPMTAAISRKFVSVSSMTVDELFGLLQGRPSVIGGLASIDRLGDGKLRLQPLICHFSNGQRWLHPLTAR